MGSPVPQLDDRNDDGFSLIEVVVAVVLMAGVLMTAAGFITKSMTTSKSIEGRQAAVTVARQVMEGVRAVPATFPPSGGSSRLVDGRSKADVAAHWLEAAAAGINVSRTYTGSGTTAFDADTYSLATGTSVSPVIPLRSTTTVSGVRYDISTYIGTCVRTDDSNTDCRKTATAGAEVFRVVVRVTWSSGAGRTCSGRTCEYVLTTLIDPSSQPTFNTQRRPIAVNDDENTDADIVGVSGVMKTLGVVLNDSGYFPVNGAVAISTPASNGTSVADTATTNNVFYTGNCGFSGVDTFRYAVTDTNNQTSTPPARVTIKVYPAAVDDALATTRPSSTLAVTANDTCGGTASVVTVLRQPTGATVTTAAGGRAVDLVTARPGTYDFTYTLTGPTGLVSAPATATVTVTKPLNAVNDGPFTVPSGSVRNVAVLANDTYNSPATVRIVSGTATLGAGGTINYQAPTAAGSYVVRYTVTDEWGESNQAEVAFTVTAPPPVVAVDDAYSVTVNRTLAFALRANDTNAAGGVVSDVVLTSGPSGGSITSYTLNPDGTGTASFDRAGTWVFSYRVTAGGTSDTGEVRITVVPAPTSSWTCWANLGRNVTTTLNLTTPTSYLSGLGPLSLAFTSTNSGSGTSARNNPTVSAGPTVSYRSVDSSTWTDYNRTYTVTSADGAVSGPFTVRLSRDGTCA